MDKDFDASSGNTTTSLTRTTQAAVVLSAIVSAAGTLTRVFSASPTTTALFLALTAIIILTLHVLSNNHIQPVV